MIDLNPFERWTGLSIQNLTTQEFLGYATNPALLKALKQAHGAETEKKMRCAIDAHGDTEAFRRFGRWFLRSYALGNAWHCFRRAPHALGFIELVLPRLIVTVWIGMLAICGSSPWPFLDTLSESAKNCVIVLCLSFAVIGRYLAVDRRTPPSAWHTLARALFLTTWGWVWGLLLVRVFFWIYGASHNDAESLFRAYWAVMPSIGSAVGVLVQEFWEDRPISEPL